MNLPLKQTFEPESDAQLPDDVSSLEIGASVEGGDPIASADDYDGHHVVNEEDVELALIAREKNDVSALDEFLSKNHFEGVDNLHYQLRQGVILMQEIQGHETGMSLHHLVHGDHSGLNMADSKKENKRKAFDRYKEFLKWVLALEKMMDALFENMHELVSKRIETIKGKIDYKLEAVKEDLEEAVDEALDIEGISSKEAVLAGTAVATTAVGAKALEKVQKVRKKKKKLLSFRKRVKKHKEVLEEVDTTQEVLEVQENLEQDYEDLKADSLGSSYSTVNTSYVSMMGSLVDASKSESEYSPQGYYNPSGDYIRSDNDSEEGEDDNITPPSLYGDE